MNDLAQVMQDIERSPGERSLTVAEVRQWWGTLSRETTTSLRRITLCAGVDAPCEQCGALLWAIRAEHIYCDECNAVAPFDWKAQPDG